ncbi:uncharacterized protein isoform X1 [Rhodnius prolixus]
MPLHRIFKFYAPKWFCVQNSFLAIGKRFMSESYYDILKVPESCSSKDIRDAFINLSKKNHPDKHLNDPTMHERFIKINEAYSVLINPLSRRAYDINLHHKKKLGAPESESYREPQRTYPRTSNSMKSESHYTNFSSYSRGDPFTFHYQAATKEQKAEQDAYYGIKGIKKVSNNRIAIVVILFTLLAVVIQLVTIRNSVIRSRERMLEESRKNSLLHAMAREKATLYGQDYQINLLKKTLKGSFGSEIDEDKPKLINKGGKNGDIDHQAHKQRSSSKKGPKKDEVCEKCKQCNHL